MMRICCDPCCLGNCFNSADVGIGIHLPCPQFEWGSRLGHARHPDPGSSGCTSHVRRRRRECWGEPV